MQHEVFVVATLSVCVCVFFFVSLCEFISDCLFARHCSFMRRLLFPLHMSMAFLWQTFYLHLVKWQMRCARRRRAVCSTKHNAADGRVLQVWVCWCVCVSATNVIFMTLFLARTKADSCLCHMPLFLSISFLLFIRHPVMENCCSDFQLNCGITKKHKKKTFTRRVPAPIYVRFVAQTDPTDDCN